MIRAALSFLFCAFVALAPVHAGRLQPLANGGCIFTGTLPLDTDVSGISRAYGTCALTKNWRNRHFADVVSNGVTYTINFINGAPDTRRLAQLMGNINPNFGVGGLPLARWYDQTGSGDDCVQNTAASRLSVWLVNGKVEIAGDGWFYKYISGTVIDRYCRVASVSTNAQASTWYFAGTPFQYGAPAGSGGAGILFQPGSGCCGGSAGAGFQFGGYGNPNAAETFGIRDWSNFTALTPPALWPEQGPLVVGLVLSAASTTVTQNEETAVNFGSTLAAQTETGVTVGADQSAAVAGQGAYAAFQGLLVYGSTTLSSGNQQAVRNSLYALFGIGKSPSYSVIVDGASYDVSQGALIGGVQGDGWVTQMLAGLPYPVRFVDMAVSGATIANLTSAWNAMAAYPCTGSYSKVVLIGPNAAAGNSIGGGETGSAAFSDLQTYLTTVKAKCPSITNIIVATLPTSGSNQYSAYNSLVLSNATSLGYTVADWNGFSPVLGAGGGPAIYNQTAPYSGHPTVAGYSYIAAPALGALRAAIGR